jgi:hypothetical protein
MQNFDLAAKIYDNATKKGEITGEAESLYNTFLGGTLFQEWIAVASKY